MVLVSLLLIGRIVVLCLYRTDDNWNLLGILLCSDGEFVQDPDTGEMTSGAYRSMELIMTQVSFGYIIRAVHHWSAHFMVASVFLHMMRVYFVGAYRNPREINWMLGSILLMITIFFVYTGYLLPCD